jgi:hypothetical protein
LLWPFDNFTLLPSERIVHYLYHFWCRRRHPCCPIDLFIGANFRSFGAREKIESFVEREENYYTTPTGTLSPFECDERERAGCVCVMKMKGFAGLLLLFAQESPILRHISFRHAFLPNTANMVFSSREME